MHCRTPILDRNLGEPLQVYETVRLAATGRRVSSGGGDLRRADRCRRHWPPSSRKANSRRSASSATSAGITGCARSTSMSSRPGRAPARPRCRTPCGMRGGSGLIDVRERRRRGTAQPHQRRARGLGGVAAVALKGWVKKNEGDRHSATSPRLRSLLAAASSAVRSGRE